MSEQKPKKDLRARLGRTISPQTPGAGPIAPPGAAVAPPVVAPVGAPAPAAATAPRAAPASIPPPVVAPPVARTGGAAKLPFGPDIAPPPFAKPAEPAKPERKRSADPFAGGAGLPPPQEVRIAVDARPVDDAEVGRRRSGSFLLVIAISLAVGAALGVGAGATNGRNVLYNTSVAAGHDVYTSVDTASRGVLEAQRHIEAIAVSAGGGASRQPSVNYAEIAALVAMPNPLPAEAFADQYYNGFTAATVDDLFAYYNDVQDLWRRFQRLSVITAGPEARATVDQVAATAVCPTTLGHDQTSARAAIAAAAAATTTAASAQYVAVLQTGSDGRVRGALRFAEAELDPTSHEPTGHIIVHVTPGDTGSPIELWTPPTAITATPTHAVLINGPNSSGVLGERLGSFRTFAQALAEMRTLMTTTIEVQGRLTSALGDIARLEPEFAF